MSGNAAKLIADLVEEGLANATSGTAEQGPLPWDSLDLRCAEFPMTDLGNVSRFVARFGHDFKFVDQWGWMAWDGKRWNSREAEAILNRAVHDVVNNIALEAAALSSLSNDYDGGKFRSDIDPVFEVKPSGKIVRHSDRLAAWCFASQSAAHVSCIARMARPYLTSSPNAFDREPLAINVQNGTLRLWLEAGEAKIRLDPHQRQDLITKIANATYDHEATSPAYDRFFNEVQPSDGMWRHLHAWGGVSFSAIPVARISFWYGIGRNGKSTLMDAWAFVMGEYCQSIPIESFLDQGRARRGGDASPDIASLPNVRCLRTSEPEKGAKLAESLIKLVTGGEPLRARHLNRDFFEFKPHFKLSMQGNHKPRIDGTDEGIWARLLLVPFSVIIPAERRDPYLGDKLKDEASGILNRLLDGLMSFLERGLEPPAEVVTATADYREDSDPIGQFIRDCTSAAPPEVRARVAGRDLWAVYLRWAAAMGEKPWSAKAFSRGLVEHGIQRLKSSGIYYLGISLTKSVSDFEGQAYDASDQ
ncbi:MAG: hypothetical protein KGO53_13695 [Alphaproteobacteria bacterium]|nr:hypothetical protein [Alphaproteobacteria bacterium]